MTKTRERPLVDARATRYSILKLSGILRRMEEIHATVRLMQM